MHIKIQGGTAPAGEPPLCHSCRRAIIVRGARLRDEIVECGVLSARVTFPVVFCTNYVNRQHPSVHDMEDIAWVLRTDAGNRRIGFVQAKTLRWHDRHVLDED